MGVFTAHPASFVIVAVYVAAWLIFDPGRFDWHAIATIATWFMTLIIQRAEHRDTHIARQFRWPVSDSKHVRSLRVRKMA
jgi:hypothetical protein